MNTLITLFLAALLSAPDYQTREAAEAGLRAAGDWETVTRLMKTAECPEARARLVRVRAALTIREVDAIRGPRPFPTADDDLGWPCQHSDEWAALLLWHGIPELTREPGRYVYSDEYGWFRYELPSADEQRARTRAGLIAYVGRTGDWATVRRVLK